MAHVEQLIEAVKRGDLATVVGILEGHQELVYERDPSGATALHYATLAGHRHIVEQLVKRGADVNAIDGRFGATPTGWAIEYLREMGGFLGIELSDLAHAIQRGRRSGLPDFYVDSRPCAVRATRLDNLLRHWQSNQETQKLKNYFTRSPPYSLTDVRSEGEPKICEMIFFLQ